MQDATLFMFAIHFEFRFKIYLYGPVNQFCDMGYIRI